MSILIKDMDMPKNCSWCPCGRIENSIRVPINNELFNVWCIVQHEHWACSRELSGKPLWCPLIEVKTPHGRLIDVDVLHEKMYHEAFEVDSEMQRWDSGCWIRYKVFENCESDCPTVIESEE